MPAVALQNKVFTYESYLTSTSEFLFSCTDIIIDAADIACFVAYRDDPNSTATPRAKVYAEVLRTVKVELDRTVPTNPLYRVAFLDLTDSVLKSEIIAKVVTLKAITWTSPVNSGMRIGVLKFQRPASITTAPDDGLTAVEIEVKQIKDFSRSNTLALPSDPNQIIRNIDCVIFDDKIVNLSDLQLQVVRDEQNLAKKVRLRQRTGTAPAAMPMDVTLVFAGLPSSMALQYDFVSLYTDPELQSQAAVIFDKLVKDVTETLDAKDVQANIAVAVKAFVKLALLARKRQSPALANVQFRGDGADIACAGATGANNVCPEYRAEVDAAKATLLLNVEQRRLKEKELLSALSEDVLSQRLQEVRSMNSKVGIRIEELMKSSRKAYMYYLLYWLCIMFIVLANIITVMIFKGRTNKIICIIMLFGYLLGFVAIVALGMTQEQTLI